ncbi:MAG: hypothetical protein QMD25_05865 [Caldisericia bacterium]|jgi:Tfp pilus assembly PilM family ATPase|nr:hypothetical protein [Caldisericia bacterium]
MERFLGLTLTKNGVKLVESRIRKGKVSIINIREGFTGNIYEKDIKVKIKRFLRESRVKTKLTSFSIPDEDVFVRVNNYPLMPDEDLKKIVLDELSTYKIFERDYPVVNIFRLKVEENRGRFLIVASPRSIVETHIKFLNTLGLEVKNVDLPSISSFRATKIFKRDLFKGSGVFIYVSFKKTTIIYFFDGEINQLREFDIGLENLSENKLQFLNEISNTIAYFSREEKKTIEKIILSGIDKGIEEILKEVKERFGIETILGEILPQKEYYFSTPIGLSLFPLEEKIKINLIPKDILERRKDEAKVFFLFLSSILLALLLIGLSIYLINSISLTGESIKNIDVNLKNVERSLENLKGIEDEFKDLNAKKEEIEGVLSKYKTTNLKIYLDEIMKIKPQEITILNLNFDSDYNFSFRISSKSIASIYEFRRKLEESQLFNEVILRGIDRTRDGNSFTTIEIKGVKK